LFIGALLLDCQAFYRLGTVGEETEPDVLRDFIRVVDERR
jgi:hypothetical protein